MLISMNLENKNILDQKYKICFEKVWFCWFPGLDGCAVLLCAVLASSGASAEFKHDLRFKFIHQDVFLSNLYMSSHTGHHKINEKYLILF